MTGAELVGLLQKVRAVGGDRWVGQCPAHEDREPSLTVREEGHRVLLHCFAGCTVASIAAALGVEPRDLFTDTQDKSETAREHRATLASVRNMRRIVAEDELRRVSEELRRRDAVKLRINAAVEAGTMTEAEAWEKLAPIYEGYREIEERFQELLGDLG